MTKPKMKMIIKPLAWTFVITCWLFYGAVTLEVFLHPLPQRDPVTDFQEGLRTARKDWGFSLFMLTAIVVYAVCWGYIRTEKETNKQKEKHED